MNKPLIVQPRTSATLAQAILDELEREYLPPYGADEQWMIQQMIENFLVRRKAKKP